jgi:penicillin-binding protein 2
VVNHLHGTAHSARIRKEGWEMAGKTGTSQVRRITLAERAAGVFKNEDLPWRRRDHALFIGFAPVHSPRYCCAAVVEHGGSGSHAAAPIVRDVLIETQRRDPAVNPPIQLVAGDRSDKA